MRHTRPAMSVVEITSPANPRIRRLAALRDRKDRDREGVFLVEGARDLDRAVGAGLEPIELYWDPERFAEPPGRADVQAVVSGPALDRASYRGRSQGLIAVFAQFDISIDRLDPGPDPMILIAESIEKPGNLGALLRTADAVGAAALIAADPTTDPFSPNVVRASTGAIFSVPLAVSALPSTLTWLRRLNIPLVAADPGASDPLWSADLSRACALMVGSEQLGLSDGARAGADQTVSIPMLGATDSLNVSVAMAVLAYESLRQRQT